MSSLILRQAFYDVSEFTSDMEGWTFRYWMPNNRQVRCSWVSDEGATNPGCLRFDADGLDDDGIFFIEKSITADIEGPIHLIGARWSIKQPPGEIGSWPRAVYIGPPKDLQHQATQHAFAKLIGKDNMPSANPGWIDHKYQAAFPSGLEEAAICIGWKINFETRRTVFLDDVSLIGH